MYYMDVHLDLAVVMGVRSIINRTDRETRSKEMSLLTQENQHV